MRSRMAERLIFVLQMFFWLIMFHVLGLAFLYLATDLSAFRYMGF